MYGHQTHTNKLKRLLDNRNDYDDVSIQELREKTALMDHCIVQKHWFDVDNPKNLDNTYKT